MRPGQLTTLTRVRSWLGMTATLTGSDAELERIILAVSAMVLQFISRPWPAATLFEEIRDGTGTSDLMLDAAPVLSVESLSVAGVAITQSPGPGQAGWALSRTPPLDRRQVLSLRGRTYPAGPGMVSVSYRAGWVTSETAVLTGDDGQTYVTVGPCWLQDEGVTTLDGVAMTKVDSDPDAGEYAVDSDGTYTFPLGLTAAIVSYSYAPADWEQAAIEIIGERFKTRDRIGQSQVNVAASQTTITFSLRDMPDFVRRTLTPYIRTAQL